MSSSGEHFGPYRILRELGAGGMGRVWLAERDDLDLPIVVKRIHSEHAEDSRFRRRLLREAEVAAGLEHPNVVRVLDTGVIDDQLYMAMEYVPGSSLAGILAASRPELLPVAPVLNAIAQACDGLAYVHRFCDPRSGRWLQLVHRDVSVDNLLVSYSGEVKLADFGIVKMADSTQTTSGVIMGKLGYMSPEQLRDEELDGRSDLYSLGVCLFELLAGRRPLPAHRGRSVMEAVLYDPPVPLEQLRQDLPPRLVALVTRLLAKDRKVRPRGGEEVAAELRALLAERDEPTLFPSKLLEAPPKNRAKPRLEPATEVERLAATKPQRLAGPAPAPGAPARRPSQVDNPAQRPPEPARRPSQEAIPEVTPGQTPGMETAAAPPPTRRPSQDEGAGPRPGVETVAAPPPTRRPSQDDAAGSRPGVETAAAPPPSRRLSHDEAAPGSRPGVETSAAPPPTRRPAQHEASPDQRSGMEAPQPTRRPAQHEPSPGQKPGMEANAEPGLETVAPPPTRRPHAETAVAPAPTRRPARDMDTAIAPPPPRRKPSQGMDTAIAPPPARRSSSEIPTAVPGQPHAYEVPTAIPGRQVSTYEMPALDGLEPEPGQGVQSTRLLQAAPSRRKQQRLLLALGGAVLALGAAAWWWLA